MRVKGGTVTHRRHKKVLDAAKGYYDPDTGWHRSRPQGSGRPRRERARGICCRCWQSTKGTGCLI